ncbi:MAG: hypothetical protein CMG88_03655 [Marinobacter sp.]|nr:hypothetical protein [Marinobacter sp.]MBP53640.1 hypothetical protein [Marinobacter sp.]|tara:strand:+ start:186 stop:365 length:180 start_codon:yes stop_codon:yes gene_type:complete
MKAGINYHAKAEHFAELASRAAFAAATALCTADREAWEERAARYDGQAAHYRNAARKAA